MKSLTPKTKNGYTAKKGLNNIKQRKKAVISKIKKKSITTKSY